MPGGSRLASGNELFDQVIYLPNVTFPTLAANASSTTQVTCNGIQPGDCISWNMVAPPAHLTIDNVYTTANTLNIQWGTDASGVSTATVNILFEVVRPENFVAGGITLLPNAIF